MPPFEFYHSAKIISENKIFIRDVYQCWYHNGLPGISFDIFSTTTFIDEEIQKFHPKNVFFVGNSMGGYAAILYASLTGYGEAIAFATQTFINPYLLLKIGDFRWKKQIFNTYLYSLFKRKAWDLKPILTKSNNRPKISIFVAKDNRLDYIHAEHIKDFPNVIIYPLQSSRHDVVKTLRDEGKLPAIMTGNYSE